MGRVLVALACVIGSSGIKGAEMSPVVATGNFSGGPCQLRLVSVTQDPSPEGRKRFNVGMRFQFETLPRKADGSTPPLPEGFFLNNGTSPLVAAQVVAGKNLVKPVHSGSAEGADGVVLVNDLEVGEARPRLMGVEIEVAIVRVTEWTPQSFDVAMGTSDFLKCGPFELRAVAEAQQVRVNAWAYPQFRAEHDAFRARMPLAFLDERYALRELKLVDAAGQTPTSIATTTPGAGAVSGTFSGWRPPSGAEAQPAGADAIVFPLKITVRMPKRFETERVRFRFPEIRLPAPPAPAK
jgi:hypothetical protein